LKEIAYRVFPFGSKIEGEIVDVKTDVFGSDLFG
jgi:hypothetical protein